MRSSNILNVVGFMLILGAGFLIFWRALTGPFMFDDFGDAAGG